MAPGVSAIIIVHDGEQFIAEAIESVIDQDGVAWELIVVDDGSSDGTGAIVRSFTGRLGDRLRLLYHPERANLGMSASRNLGISGARAAYVAFLDADDQWLPGKLAEQVTILDSEPATAMVYGRTQIWNSWDPSSKEPDFFYELGVDADTAYPAGALFGQLLANRYQSPTTCNAMIRREALLAVGGCDPALRGMFEDQLLFAKLLLQFPVHVSSRLWARYRQHPQSASSAMADLLTVDQAQLRFLAALRRHMRQTGAGRLQDRRTAAVAATRVAGRIAGRRAKRALRRRAS